MSLQFSISINEIVDLLGLEKDPKSGGAISYYVRCPFCGDKRYHMNINAEKNTYNCNRCTSAKTGGGALDLYGRVALHTELKPGKPEQGGNGSVIYASLKEALRGTAGSVQRIESAPPARQRPTQKAAVVPADDSFLDRAYSALLSFPELRLSEIHHQALIKRGLSSNAIRRGGYRSIDPSFAWVEELGVTDATDEPFFQFNAECKAHEALRNMQWQQRAAGWVLGQYVCGKLGEPPKRVPGFFRLGDSWFFRADPGMLIPTRNSAGEIVGLQVRKDSGNLRYMTVSSKGLPEGVSEKISRLHFPLGNAEIGSGAPVYFTEGPLKADVALELLREPAIFIACQGVNNRSELPDIFAKLHKAGVTAVRNALDMDKITNPHVAAACNTIRSLAVQAGLDWENIFWDPAYALRKLMELSALCRYNHVPGPEFTPDIGTDAVFTAVAEAAAALHQHGRQHSTSGLGVKPDHHYWSDRTKGIDDYLKSVATNQSNKKT